MIIFAPLPSPYACMRYTQGWAYGPVKHDGQHKHPLLVPFDNLSTRHAIYLMQNMRDIIKVSCFAIGCCGVLEASQPGCVTRSRARHRPSLR